MERNIEFLVDGDKLSDVRNTADDELELTPDQKTTDDLVKELEEKKEHLEFEEKRLLLELTKKYAHNLLYFSQGILALIALIGFLELYLVWSGSVPGNFERQIDTKTYLALVAGTVTQFSIIVATFLRKNNK